MSDRRLLIFAGCILLFQLANAAMLPMMGSILTMRSSAWASTLIAACIIVPTVIVAGVAPWVGRQADAWGRRPLLLLCFAALALRGVLFALVSSPYLVVAVQVLDGVCAAVLGVILPLVVADIMRGTGRFNLGLGIVGSAVGIGAALSTTLAGFMMDRFGSSLAFWSSGGRGRWWADPGLAAASGDPPRAGANTSTVVISSLNGRFAPAGMLVCDLAGLRSPAVFLCLCRRHLPHAAKL